MTPNDLSLLLKTTQSYLPGLFGVSLLRNICGVQSPNFLRTQILKLILVSSHFPCLYYIYLHILVTFVLSILVLIAYFSEILLLAQTLFRESIILWRQALFSSS